MATVIRDGTPRDEFQRGGYLHGGGNNGGSRRQKMDGHGRGHDFDSYGGYGGGGGYSAGYGHCNAATQS